MPTTKIIPFLKVLAWVEISILSCSWMCLSLTLRWLCEMLDVIPTLEKAGAAPLWSSGINRFLLKYNNIHFWQGFFHRISRLGSLLEAFSDLNNSAGILKPVFVGAIKVQSEGCGCCSSAEMFSQGIFLAFISVEASPSSLIYWERFCSCLNFDIQADFIRYWGVLIYFNLNF